MTPRLLVSLLFLRLIGCTSAEVVRGNGNLVEVERTTPAFASVAVSNNFRAEVTVADPHVRIAIDDNLLALVRTDISGGELSVGPEAGYDLAPSPAAVVTVSSPTIDGIATSGSANVVAAVNGRDATLAASGASNLFATTSAATALSVEASGEAQVAATGSAARLVVTASGASSVTLDSAAVSADIESSGTANVTIYASMSVRVRASGTSVVTVIGSPTARDVEVSGEARVAYSN